MPAGTYSIHVLASESGVSARPLREWITHKVLPRPIGRGRGARYDDRHLLRARVVQHLRSSGTALRDIRSRLASLPEREVQALAPPPPPPKTPDGVPVAPSPPTYPFTSWEQVELADGLVLMVNPAKGAVLRRIAADIYRHYALRA